ncbi:hypothetical protein [Streptomyces sp. NPDC088752]|uniref:hypothetical protein n=1 Tax=Streptomyces sp. NPDC088752 TaxID=3154963 RepID=UPI0034452E30
MDGEPGGDSGGVEAPLEKGTERADEIDTAAEAGIDEEAQEVFVAVVSEIGVRHEGAHALVSTGLYLDLSRVLRNPADDPTMRYRTGLDGDVYAHVLKTPAP